MQNNYLPELNNPMISLIQGNFPGLHPIVENAMPIQLPRMTYETNVLSQIFGVYKRRKMEEATRLEAQIAKNTRDALISKLEGLQAFITSSSKVADELGIFEHNKTMRALEIQEKQAQVYLLQAQAQSAGYEAKMSELDYNVKSEQLKEMLNGSPKA